MTRVLRAVVRVTTIVLPALSLALVMPGTAHATARTYSLHDGTAEAGLPFQPDDGRDLLSVGFFYPEGTVSSANSATLRIYGRAGGCGPGTTGTQAIYNNSGELATEFDPCAVFPTTGYGWASLPVPVSTFHWWSPAWATKLHPEDRPGEHYAIFAFDTDTEAGGTYSYSHDLATDTYTDHPGEAMWELVLDGNAPAIAVSPKSLSYGIVEPGTTTAARRVTVTSTGTRDISSVGGVTVSGTNAGDFAIAADTCTGNPLPYGATCTVDVTFTPSGVGARSATLTADINGGIDRSVTLAGEGRSLPPQSAITTPDGAMLLPDGAVTGTVTDDLGVAYEQVTFAPELPGPATVTSSASLSCTSPATSCTWSVSTLLLTPGRYTVTAFGIDTQGVVGPVTPGISVLVI